MTYGPDAQPDIRFQGDGLQRGLHRSQSRVLLLSRLIRDEIRTVRRLREENSREAGRSVKWIRDAWVARGNAQVTAAQYRVLIAERDMAGVCGGW